MSIPTRKDDHIRFSLEHDVQTHVSAGFEDITLIHSSLPEMAYSEIDTSVELFGKTLSCPCMISALTGGSPLAGRINASLARLADRYNIGISVGSQRAMHVDASLSGTYGIREHAPDALLFSNIGIAQLVTMKNEEVHELVGSIGADVLAVHLNPLQEVVQPEGDTDFCGGVGRLREIKDDAPYPVIVKETGAGISAEVAERVSFLDGIDVAGVGGTSFAAVEYYRTPDAAQRESARLFWDWGIPTVPSIVEVADHFDTIIASGGIRNGIHIAKSIAMGASCAGLAWPFLAAAHQGDAEASDKEIEKLQRELRMSMLLTGSRTIGDLARKSVILKGPTRQYIIDRGFSAEFYARKEEFI